MTRHNASVRAEQVLKMEANVGQDSLLSTVQYPHLVATRLKICMDFYVTLVPKQLALLWPEVLSVP